MVKIYSGLLGKLKYNFRKIFGQMEPMSEITNELIRIRKQALTEAGYGEKKAKMLAMEMVEDGREIIILKEGSSDAE